MELMVKDRIWFACFVAWIILFLGPGLLLFNHDVYVFNMPLLWLWAIVGWLTSLVLVYIEGYHLSITNVETEEVLELKKD